MPSLALHVLAGLCLSGGSLLSHVLGFGQVVKQSSERPHKGAVLNMCSLCRIAWRVCAHAVGALCSAILQAVLQFVEQSYERAPEGHSSERLVPLQDCFASLCQDTQSPQCPAIPEALFSLPGRTLSSSERA